MEITKVILSKYGADPAVYSCDEKMRIGDYVDKIVAGRCGELIKNVTFPEKDIESVRISGDDEKKALFKNMTAFSEKIKSISDICNTDSVFSSSIPEAKRDEILVKSAETIKNANAYLNEALDCIASIFAKIDLMREIENRFNLSLAELGLINLSQRIANDGKDTDESDALIEVLGERFETLNEFTAYINDLKDKTVICQRAFEKDVDREINNIVNALDFEKDGEKLDCRKAINAASAISVIINEAINI